MATMKLVDVWQALIGSLEGVPAEMHYRPVSAVVVDSREAVGGSLFVALRGDKVDGSLFLADAFERGAIAAIAGARALELGLTADFGMADGTVVRHEGPEKGTESRRPFVFVVEDSLSGLQRLAGFWRDQIPALSVAVTGSVGKTTTKEIVSNVLEQRYVTLRSEGNLNNEIGLPLTLLRLRPEHQRVVLEMGMYAVGEIAMLCRLARPRIGVLTNIGPVHLERLGTIERIAEAKAELVMALPPADEGGVAVLNADDPLVRAMAGLTQARVITYGLTPSADLWADDIVGEGLDGIRFRLHYGREVIHLRLPMLGRHSVHTALRATAVGLADGLSWTEIITGLEKAQGQLRLMIVPGLRDTRLIDDSYNASPESMLAALNLLEDITGRSEETGQEQRAVAVLGDMMELGSFEEEGHRLAGGRAAEVLARRRGGKLVAVGVRARWIAEEAELAGMPAADIHAVVTNADAIAVLQGLIRTGDVLLIKGSRSAGMEAIADALSRPRAQRVEG